MINEQNINAMISYLLDHNEKLQRKGSAADNYIRDFREDYDPKDIKTAPKCGEQFILYDRKCKSEPFQIAQYIGNNVFQVVSIKEGLLKTSFFPDGCKWIKIPGVKYG